MRPEPESTHTPPIGVVRHRTLQVKLFAWVAAIVLIALVALVEFSIRQHHSHMLDAIARDGIRQVMSQPLAERQALGTADKATFGAFATRLLTGSNVVSVQLGSARGPESWLVTRDTLANDSGDYLVHVIQGTDHRLFERGDRHTLEIAIPTRRLAMLSRPQVSETREAEEFTNTLRLGLDATEAFDATRTAARETRDAQAVIAALMLLALWLVSRRILRPIEKLVDDAERIAAGRDPSPAFASNSGEARRLHHALATLAVRKSTSPPDRTELERSAIDRSASAKNPREINSTSSNYAALHPAPKAAKAARAARAAKAQESAPSRARSIKEQNYRVLLAEDNPVNRAVAIDMLDLLGCEAESARDGVECLALFDSGRFDLIFIDIQMPKMDGLEATRKIRILEEQLGLDPTPIIALTAHSEPQDLNACRRAGMNGHIGKPFRTSDLEQALLEWASTRKPSERSD